MFSDWNFCLTISCWLEDTSQVSVSVVHCHIPSVISSTSSKCWYICIIGYYTIGFLSWLDVSIGKIVSQFRARHEPIGVMCQNPDNAVIHAGHSNGTVTLWAPSSQKPLASVLCHGSGLKAITVDNAGR